MSSNRFFGSLRNTLLALLLGGGAIPLYNGAVAAPDPYGVDTLYAIPSLIGTEPRGVVWSASGGEIAFLWNNRGETFRNIWIYDPSSSSKRQLTRIAADTDAALEHEGIGEVSWFGPGSEQLAYTLDGQLYVADRQGKTRLLDLGLAGIHQLTASPDGRRLSFVARGVAGEKTALGKALWSLDYTPQGAEPTARLLLDPGHGDSSVKSHQWSLDGRQISFELQHMSAMAKREIHYYREGELKIDTVTRAFPGEPNLRFDVGVLSLKTGEVRILERQDTTYPVWNYGLSDSGDRLFINESDPYVKLHRIEMYTLASGERSTFYQEHDARHLRPDWRAAWAPGDDGLIILTDKDGYLHLYHQKTASGEAQRLTSGDWEISDFAVADSRDEVYFRSNKAHVAGRQLYRVSLDSGEVTQVSDAVPGTHHVVYAPDMQAATSIFSNDQTPPDLYLINFDNPRTERITESPAAAFHDRSWAEVRYVKFKSHVDDTLLIGRLSLPADYNPEQRYPLIVGSVYSDSVRNQWGGRTAHPTWGLDQHLVAQGYLLLNVNVRGSWGQGRKHNQGLLHSYGNIDIDDLHSGVLHLVREGYVDPARVGIWGSSYGGLMTMMSLFKKPEVYAVGIAGAPATNVWHAYPEQMWVMGPATGPDMPARYERQSPLYHTDGLQDPLMIIHGSRDEVVLYSDTIAVVNKLITREQAFELVTLPGAGHGWDAEKNDQRRFAFKKMVDFFNRHLKPREK